MLNNSKTVNDYADDLLHRLTENLNPDLLLGSFAAKFRRAFRLNARRVRSQNYADLSSWVFLECLEHKIGHGHLPPEEVLKTLNRVRHRIAQQGRREIQISRELAEYRAGDSAYRESLELLKIAASRFTPLHVSLFERHFLDGKSVEALSRETGLSKPTVYRMIRDIKLAFMDLLKSSSS